MAAPKIKSLSQGYVFYERLKEEKDPEKRQLYDIANEGVEKYVNFYQDNDLNAIATKLLSMSQQELIKEQSALHQVFDLPTGFIDLDDPKQVKDLIETFNATLGLKSAYERNVARIKSNKKQAINVATFFSGYFMDAWKEKEAKIMNSVAELYRIDDENSIKEMQEYLEISLRDVAKSALRKMLNSKDFADDLNSAKGYEELLKILNKFQGTNRFTQAMSGIYHFDTIAQKIIEQLQIQEAIGSPQQAPNDLISFEMKKGYYSKGGLVLEHLENFIGSAIVEGVQKSSKGKIQVKGKVLHSGASEMKADNIFTFGINPDRIQQVIDDISRQQTNRENITREIQALSQELAEISSGFIVYSSAKNYVSQENGNFAGFSGGAPVSVKTMRNITEDKTKMGAILQTVNGAVGADQREEIKFSIAEDIAYYLFDDFSTIGVPQQGVQALHLFDLDGIYVPLSVLLHKLGRAIQEVKKVPTSLLTVKIHNPTSILYSKDEIQPKNAWQKQKEDAANNTKISVAFFKDFFAMIRSF